MGSGETGNGTQFDRDDDESIMSSELGRGDSDISGFTSNNPKRFVSKKYSEINLDEGRISEIEQHLEELDSPLHERDKDIQKNMDVQKDRDVLEDAFDLVDDDDMISQYSANISVLNSQNAVKIIDTELQKEENYYAQTLKSSLKLIDKSKNIQVFYGPLEQPFDNLDIIM